MTPGKQVDKDRRSLLIGAGLFAAVVIPAGIYGVPRLLEGPIRNRDNNDPLTGGELALVSAMSEGIIPQTDTPGAVGAGVPQFIELLFNEWMLPEEQAHFRKGLVNFNDDSLTRFGKPFVALSPDQQHTMLVDWDEQASRDRAANATQLPPFARFKSITVIAYYTSQVGQEQELKVAMDGGQANPDGPLMMPIPFNL